MSNDPSQLEATVVDRHGDSLVPSYLIFGGEESATKANEPLN